MHHLQGTASNPHQQDNRINALQYDGLKALLPALARFLSKKTVLMAWVEALYTYASGKSPFLEGLVSWSKWMGSFPVQDSITESGAVAKDVLAFSQDLPSLHDSWGDIMLNLPHEIRGDITAITPSRFFAETSASSADSLLPTQPDGIALSSSSLSTVSCLDSAGREVGVLSIWLSK